MFKTFANAWKIPELRKKILFTALIVLIFRVGSAIPVPFTNILIEGGNLVQEGSTFLNYLIMMTGDAFNYGTLFALSITPYINSSIIMQLLCVAIPPLERLAKEEDGQKKIASITRYVTVVLGIIQSVAYYFYIRSAGYLSKAADGSAYTGFAMVFQAIVIILCFTAGTALIMWLGEQRQGHRQRYLDNPFRRYRFENPRSDHPALRRLGHRQLLVKRRRLLLPFTLRLRHPYSDGRIHRVDGQR
jgi:preprotein translocase subunit SecY